MKPRQPGYRSMDRRDFLKKSVVTAGAIGAAGGLEMQAAARAENAPSAAAGQPDARAGRRPYNGPYTGEYLDRVAFPLGGIGAGMICLEGTGALSHLSIRNKPDVFNEPCTFAAVCVKGEPNVSRVLQGPVPTWKLFGPGNTGNGGGGKTYGLPRFAEATFEARFPFATIALADPAMPLKVGITAWSPFEPGDPDSASLPMAALEYRFVNTSDKPLEAVFSFNTRNFMGTKEGKAAFREAAGSVRPCAGGFVLQQAGSEAAPWDEGFFSATVDDPAVKVNCGWFRGGWFDPLTMAWKDVQAGACALGDASRAVSSPSMPMLGNRRNLRRTNPTASPVCSVMGAFLLRCPLRMSG